MKKLHLSIIMYLIYSSIGLAQDITFGLNLSIIQQFNENIKEEKPRIGFNVGAERLKIHHLNNGKKIMIDLNLGIDVANSDTRVMDEILFDVKDFDSSFLGYVDLNSSNFRANIESRLYLSKQLLNKGDWSNTYLFEPFIFGGVGYRSVKNNLNYGLYLDSIFCDCDYSDEYEIEKFNYFTFSYGLGLKTSINHSISLIFDVGLNQSFNSNRIIDKESFYNDNEGGIQYDYVYGGKTQRSHLSYRFAISIPIFGQRTESRIKYANYSSNTKVHDSKSDDNKSEGNSSKSSNNCKSGGISPSKAGNANY